MASVRTVGKYQLGGTIGVGSFAKVKLAKNITNGQKVAIKIIDKQMVVSNNLMYQVEREIRTMKLLKHPNIVRIHEVIGTKMKIYIVMEYVAGGQLSDKLSYAKPLTETEARRYFQQLIDAVDYCHCRGVYHRDLKPENLLLDCKGNLKVSDFGLSILRKPGSLLLTACGSPSYVAPELLKYKGYEGAAADVWACGVVLFEMLAGYLPFNDHNLLNLYAKILRVEYECPQWFTTRQKKLIGRIFNPIPEKRITIEEIIRDEWFQIHYEPAVGIDFEVKDTEQIQPAFDSAEENAANQIICRTPGFINAFQLIALSRELNLSSLFSDQDDYKRMVILGSKHTVENTMRIIETAAEDASLSVEKTSFHKSDMQLKVKSKARPYFTLLAEVTQVAPTDCVVEISICTRETELYQKKRIRLADRRACLRSYAYKESSQQ